MTQLIAITGGSGAGKTTIARALAQGVDGAVVLGEDDYYRCASAIPNFDADTHNFDAPAAKDDALLGAHLEAAKAGLSFEKPRYDLVTHTRRPERELVAPTPMLVVEGIHVLAFPELARLFDLKVFIEADEALRLGRRMIRDVESRGRSPRSVLRQFFTNVRPMHDLHVAPQRRLADLVLTSSPDDDLGAAETQAARIMAALRARD